MRPALPVALGLLLAWAGLRGQDAYVFDTPALTVPSQPLGGPRSYDADVLADPDGTTLEVVWLEHDPAGGDRMRYGRRDADGWLHREELPWEDLPAARTGRLARPRLTRDGDTLWLTYEARPPGATRWNVFARHRLDGRWSAARAVGPAGVGNVNHAAAASPVGGRADWGRGDAPRRPGLWVVWQGESEGTFQIHARRLFADEDLRTAPVQVSVAGAAWHPEVAVDARGWAWIVWDRFDGEDFDVVGRRHEGDAWGPVLELASGPAFQARAQVALDARDRAWVAWEEGAANWGREHRSVNKLWNNATDASGPLHRATRVRLGTWTMEGALVPAPDLPMPAFGAAAADGARRADAGDVGIHYERPRLVLDGSDRPWVAFRHFADLQLGRQEPVRHHVEDGWRIQARCLGSDADGATVWSGAVGFGLGQRDGGQRLALAPLPGGFAAVWGTGRSDRRVEHPDRRGLALGRVELAPGAAPGPVDSPLRGTPAALDPDPARRTDSPDFAGSDAELSAYFGDLHRHTDLSLCFPFFDGSLDDAYRYGIEVAELDFLAVTDHTRDIDRGDVQSLLWWRSTKEVERHQLAGRFVPFFGYERSHGDTDHNVISLRDDMLRNFPPPLPEFWGEITDADTLTIPHNPFIGKVWEHHDDAKRPLLEIYQGCRDESSEAAAHAALDRGYHLGFVASSDHMSTSASYAGVWSAAGDRESLFRALQARRTFAATDRIRLALRTADGGHWMGERVDADRLPPLTVEVAGTGPIERVELWRDGALWRTVEGSANDPAVLIREVVPDSNAKPLAAETWVYARVHQRDGHRAWSSPLWFRPARDER